MTKKPSKDLKLKVISKEKAYWLECAAHLKAEIAAHEKALKYNRFVLKQLKGEKL